MVDGRQPDLRRNMATRRRASLTHDGDAGDRTATQLASRSSAELQDHLEAAFENVDELDAGMGMSPDPEVQLHDWDVPLGMLQELYLGGKQTLSSSSPAVTVRSGTEELAHLTIGNAAPPHSSIASSVHSVYATAPMGIPSVTSSPSRVPSGTPQRVRTASNASVGSSSAVPLTGGGLHRVSSNASASSHNRTRSHHADTPRHATVTRHRSIRSGGGGSGHQTPAGTSGVHFGTSPSTNALASLARGGFGDRHKLMSYSPAHRAPYLPVRVLGFEQKKRILVTGAAGFVGSHLVDRLMLMGHEVLCIDNFFTGVKSSLSHWIGHPNFELQRHDVVNPLLVEVDQIYHLACPASPKSYQVNQVKTLKTNFMGTMNMLGLAKRTKARFLLASTSEVYGDPDVHPQPESYNGNVNPTGPRGCYDEGKRIAETLTYGYLYQDNVDVRVARIFNTYGPRMHPYDGRVVSNFLLQGLRGEPLTVYGDGSQTRSFMFIHDLIDGLVALMEAEDPPEGAEAAGGHAHEGLLRGVHGPVNIGNPNEFTIKDLVEEVAIAVQQVRKEMQASGRGHLLPQPGAVEPPEGAEATEMLGDIRVVYCPMPQDDPRQRRPDTTRASQLLAWEPKWGLKEGLLEMARYYAQQMEEGTM